MNTSLTHGMRPFHTFGAVVALSVAQFWCGVSLAAPATDQAEAVKERPSATGAVFVDPLGFAMFGPIVGAELALGPASVSLYGRWLSGGYLAQQLFPNDEEAFAFSYGVGLRGRYYVDGGLNGLFVGVAAEYLASRIENDQILIATKTSLLVPQLEGGYRYGFGEHLFLGGSAAVGYALQIGDSVENLSGGDQAELYEVEDVSTVYGSLGLELGVKF